MDEIDAIGGRRFSEGTSADREIQRTLMELLSQLDGFDVVGQARALPTPNLEMQPLKSLNLKYPFPHRLVFLWLHAVEACKGSMRLSHSPLPCAATLVQLPQPDVCGHCSVGCSMLYLTPALLLTARAGRRGLYGAPEQASGL